MATEKGKWETVVTKKKGHVSKGDVKRAKQNFLENSSQFKADFKNPLEEAATMYTAAFGDKDSQTNKENKNPDNKYPSFHPVEGQKKGAQPSSPKKAQQKHKKQKAQKPSPLEGIEEKIKKINLEELTLVINNVQEKFPTHSLIWLKEVASWLQKQISGPAEKDLMLSSQPKGFPANLVDSAVKKELLELLKKSSEQSIEMLFCYCLTMMLEELNQGRLTIGLRILVQLIISHSPKILITKMDEVLNGKAISQESFLTVIWAYSQSINDLKTGLKIWWAVMLPVLRVGTHAPHVVQFIEDLLRKHEKGKINDAVIDAKKFYEILTIVYSQKSQLANSPSLKARFDALYPIFKRMYLTDKPNGPNKDKFKKLLTMLSVEDAGMQAEILTLLVLCLSKDETCFDAWLECLEKNLKASSILWEHIYGNYAIVRQELMKERKYKNKDVIQKKAEDFWVELLHIKRKGHGSKVGFAECYSACYKFQKLEPVKQESRFSLYRLLKFLLFGAFIFFAVDIYTTKGYKGSRTESAAVSLGIDSYVAASVIQLEGIAGSVGRWSKDNLPQYYAKVSPYVDPVIETTWEYSFKISQAVYEHSKPAIDFISRNTEKLFEKIDDLLPGYKERIVKNASTAWNAVVPTVKHYMNGTISFISTNTPIVIEHTTQVLNSTCNWIYELHPPFFEKAAMHVQCAVHCLREYLAHAWQLVVEYAPIVMETTVDSFRLVVAMLQSYFAAGQTWVQNALRSTTGGSPATSN